jgi:NAD-dependent deacetylase
VLRPDIVWFGEIPLYMDEIAEALRHCGVFVAIGTSGQVWPAAGFVREVRGRARTVELNLEPSGGAALFDEVHTGPATQVVPEWVAGLLG